MPQLTAECRSMLEGRNFDHVVAHEPDNNAEHFAKLVTEYRGGRPMVDRGTPRHGHGRKPRWRVGHRERLGSRCTGTETAAGQLRKAQLRHCLRASGEHCHAGGIADIGVTRCTWRENQERGSS
jgi:hypothetical protein